MSEPTNSTARPCAARRHAGHRRLWWTTALALTLGASGCEDGGFTEAPVPTPPDAEATPTETAPITITVVDATSGLLGPPLGALRLRAYDSASGQTVDQLLTPAPLWPGVHIIETLPVGSWALTAYIDRDANQAFDDCPFPPEPAHTELAESLDNIQGGVIAQIGRQPEVTISVERTICGPGESGTGITGEVVKPADAILRGVPIYGRLQPVEDDQPPADGAPARRALQITVFPSGLSQPTTAFEIGELVPGRYRLELFADGDGNGRPTPCGPMVGGGDRYSARTEPFEVVAGERAPLPAAINLEAAPCPEALTGLTGTVSFDPELAELLASDRTLAEPFAILGGALRLELVDPEDGAVVAAVVIEDDLSARPPPRPFTVTGLEPGEWDLRAYLDRDADGRYSPCSAEPAGFDTISARLEGVQVEAERVDGVGAMTLSRGPCAAPTGVTGEVQVEVEPGPLGSGRPVRLDLAPLDAAAEAATILLFNDHRALAESPARFARELAPGRYRASVHVDSDRDGELTACTLDPFSDRATSDSFDIEVIEGELTTLPETIEVTTLGCPAPIVTLTPRVELAPGLDGGEGPLWLEILEDGGWATRIELGPIDWWRGVDLDPIHLAPGTFRITAFADPGGDGLDDCDAMVPDPWQARVEVDLGAETPEARPILRLAPCDR